MTTKIILSENKHKIIIEYPIKEPHLGFDYLDLDKVVVNVFLKNDVRIYQENIESITIKAKVEKCELCRKFFLNEFDMKEHKTQMHDAEVK
jgi:hypothetical protein